jgi:hypothetical protein
MLVYPQKSGIDLGHLFRRERLVIIGDVVVLVQPDRHARPWPDLGRASTDATTYGANWRGKMAWTALTLYPQPYAFAVDPNSVRDIGDAYQILVYLMDDSGRDGVRNPAGHLDGSSHRIVTLDVQDGVCSPVNLRPLKIRQRAVEDVKYCVVLKIDIAHT